MTQITTTTTTTILAKLTVSQLNAYLAIESAYIANEKELFDLQDDSKGLNPEEYEVTEMALDKYSFELSYAMENGLANPSMLEASLSVLKVAEIKATTYSKPTNFSAKNPIAKMLAKIANEGAYSKTVGDVLANHKPVEKEAVVAGYTGKKFKDATSYNIWGMDNFDVNTAFHIKGSTVHLFKSENSRGM